MKNNAKLKCYSCLRNATIFLLALTIMSVVVACENNEGLKIGFSRSGRLPSILCAVKSDKTQFNLEEVSLDYYYGGVKLEKYEGYDYKPVSIAICFRDSKYQDGKSIQSMTIEDYKAIKGFYFIKEISFEQYNSGNYDVETNRFSDLKFTHNETLTVPKEIVNLAEGYFSFVVMDVYFSEKDNNYLVQTAGFVDIKYKNIDGTNIHLSKP